MSTAVGAPAEQVQIVTPECERGIGKVILNAQSPDLIEGVLINPVSLWPDDRGYFLEVARLGSGMTAEFPLNSTQVSAALSYPGTIKAFHVHRQQTDCWLAVQGMFQVALVDMRRHSGTWGLRNTMYIGALRPWQILVPPGVAHGYKVIGADPALLIYLTDRFYNPEDEGRIAYNDPGIFYDWETQHK